MKAGDPAFGARLERCYILGWQMEAHHLVEERGRLVGGETQIGSSKLSQLSAPAQATEWQRRIDATSDHHVQLRWQVVQ